MSKSIRVLGVRLRILAVVMMTGAAASAQSSGVVFHGLTHTAVGSGALRVDLARDTLTVNTFDPAGEDGVAIGKPGATSWTARLEATAHSALPLSLSWQALADGQRVSTATMRQVGENFDVSALFTGSTTSTYSVQVRNNGRLVGALGSLPPTAHTVFPASVCGIPGFAQLFDCRFVSRFHNTANGECVWEFVWDRAVTVRLPNGITLTGNELRLMEEVRPPGSYSYESFDTVVMQTTADALTLLAESVR